VATGPNSTQQLVIILPQGPADAPPSALRTKELRARAQGATSRLYIQFKRSLRALKRDTSRHYVQGWRIGFIFKYAKTTYT